MSKKIIICGLGGLARECFSWISDNNKKKNDIFFKGFLGPVNDLKKFNQLEDLYLGKEEDYSFLSNDHVIVAIGNQIIRKKVVEKLKKYNVSFYSFIHHTAIIGHDVKLGEGVIIAPNTIFSTHISIGDFNLINYGTTIAHDVEIGSHNTFCPHVDINGSVSIGENNFIGGRVSLTPKSCVRNNCKIAAGSVLYGLAKNNAFMVGNPAIRKTIL